MAQNNLGGGNGKASTYNRDVSRGRPCTAAPSPAKEEYEHNHNCARAYLAWPFHSEAHATIRRVPSTTGITATALSCLGEPSAASARNLPVVESAPGGMRAAVGDRRQIQYLLSVSVKDEARLDRRRQRGFELLQVFSLAAGIEAIQSGRVERLAHTDHEAQRAAGISHTRLCSLAERTLRSRRSRFRKSEPPWSCCS